MRRLFICLSLLLAVSACGAKSVWAPDDKVAAAAYSTGEPPSVTLFTVVQKKTGGGGHSALMIDGTQRVIFDPAGTWYHPWVPERNDVHYGITEQMRKFYIDYHARNSWNVTEQKVYVPLAVAEELRHRAEAYGPSPKMMCANAVSKVLEGVPGFDTIHHTYLPKRLSEQFGKLPGATFKLYHDSDPDNNSGVLMIQKDDPRAAEIRHAYD